MSDLTAFEKIKLESMFNMKTGYVLNFSDRTFQEFFINSVGLDLFDSKYETKGTSKANRMRTFWEKEDDFTVGKLLKDILYCIDELGRIDNTQKEELTKISERLLQTSPVPDLDALQPNTEEKDFEIIAKAAREAIEGNNPEQGLDRLHTFIIKFFRELCNKHGITVEKRKPLHSLVGEYLKVIKQKGLIESNMAERIIKSSISVMESFNDVRNNLSLAHDNPILNYNESILIYNFTTSIVRFISQIEERSPNIDIIPPCDSDDIPF